MAAHSPTEGRWKYLRTLRAVGFTGAILTALTIAITAAFLSFVSSKLLMYLVPVFQSGYFPRRSIPLVRSGITLLLWLPLIPVLLASAFLPVRLAWIHGRVRISHFADGFGDAFSRSTKTLRATLRQLIVACLPFIGLVALLTQGENLDADPQLMNFLAILAAAVCALIIWQAGAFICAVPVAIVSQCTAHAAATECKYIIRSRHRLMVFLLLSAVAGCAFGALLVRHQRWELWQIDAALSGLGILAWTFVTIFGAVCIDASIEYLKIKANEPKSPEATQYYPNAPIIIPGVEGYLPNGQPINVQIQTVQMPRK